MKSGQITILVIRPSMKSSQSASLCDLPSTCETKTNAHYFLAKFSPLEYIIYLLVNREKSSIYSDPGGRMIAVPA